MGLNITDTELDELRAKMAEHNDTSAPAEPEDSLDDVGARVYGSATPGQYIAPRTNWTTGPGAFSARTPACTWTAPPTCSRTRTPAPTIGTPAGPGSAEGSPAGLVRAPG